MSEEHSNNLESEFDLLKTIAIELCRMDGEPDPFATLKPHPLVDNGVELWKTYEKRAFYIITKVFDYVYNNPKMVISVKDYKFPIKGEE